MNMVITKNDIVIKAVRWSGGIPWFFTNDGVFRGGYGKKGLAFNLLGRGIIALSECKAVM